MPKMIPLDDDVDAYIREHGRFGESYSDVFRRRLLDFPAQQQTSPEVATHPSSPPQVTDNRRKRFLLFGQSACAVIRWMGQQGWKFAEVRRVLNGCGLHDVNDVTIYCQLQWEKRGAPANLSEDEIRELLSRREQHE
jgi:hypothetical protein